MKPRTDPARVRQLTTYPVDLMDGSVLLRRVDLMNLVLTGKLEVSLMSMAEKFERVAEGVGSSTMRTVAAIQSLPLEDRQGVIDMLRAFAVAAIADPVYTMVDDGDPAHVPVETLMTRDLLRIWSATPPAAVAVDPKQPVVVPATEAQAERFPRSTPAREPVPESEVSDRTDFVPANEGVETTTIRTPDGGLVEFASM